MELQSISVVSKQFHISVRTLRYYEQIGLIKSERKEESSYRYYSADTIRRIQQIIILRKLRIPLKQIAELLESESSDHIIEVFEQNLNEIEEEITALTTIKSIIRSFIQKLNRSGHSFKLLDDKNLLEIIDSLTATKINFKEDKTMGDLNRASARLNKLTDKDVRIVYLPPATVASIHLIGNRPEDRASALLRQFVEETELARIKPDFRHYGFNHPNGTNDDDHGYEYWVTIPDELRVEPPFTKKFFQGGLYAAHTISFGNFEAWHWLWKWVEKNDHVELNLGDPACMDGLLEEHLNYFNQYQFKNFDKDKFQMDLLIPIKEKG